jgi:hypothetical protein
MMKTLMMTVRMNGVNFSLKLTFIVMVRLKIVYVYLDLTTIARR